ncbi:MAG: hypothetical protein OJF49_002877 [Ktedonobacterales bacterium]|nr:MAG: hypothetical protein OJF49_002877 [Ktedonobacterales bacterium]
MSRHRVRWWHTALMGLAAVVLMAALAGCMGASTTPQHQSTPIPPQPGMIWHP